MFSLSFLIGLFAALIVILCVALVRIATLLPPIRKKLGWSTYRSESFKPDADTTCKVAVMLGSGGHTSELLQLLSALPPERYTPRLYLVSAGDQFSANKARKFEENVTTSSSKDQSPVSEDSKDGESHYEIVQIPRAREVHQPWIFVPLSTIVSLGECIRIVFASRKEEMRQVGSERALSSRVNDRRPFADLLIMNGPGTCVPLVLAAYLLRMLSLPSPRLIYVESFARVKSLSLTAKLLRHVVDKFVVQWPEAGGNDECKGWLV